MKLTTLLTIAILSVTTSLHASILFSENFDEAPLGPWAGYGGWQGSSVPLIDDFGGDKRGVFPASPSDPSNLSVSLGTNYGLNDQAYRLSFEISGYMSRQFNVSLVDNKSNRIGLQFSDSSNSRSILALTTINGQSQSHTTGGFNGGTTTWPNGFNPNTLYKVHIDINGTDSDIEIEGLLLGAKRARVIYNSEDQTMATYVMEFALPDEFASISGIRISKDTRADLLRTIDNLELTAYAIPEASSAMMIIGGATLFALGSAFRKRTPRSAQ